MTSKKPLKTIIPAITARVRLDFEGVPGSHDWGHVERVLALCMHISRVEGGDRDVLTLAAILHDIGRLRKYNRGRHQDCHAESGAVIAKGILEAHGLDADLTDRVVHCIAAHRYRGENRPESLEARILFDADKLDSIGAVGVGRDFMFAAEIGARFHNGPEVDLEKTKPFTREDTAYREYVFKLQDIHKRMLTGEGRRLARERHAFMKAFFKRMLREIRGEI
jgi:uncharacterized protein